MPFFGGERLVTSRHSLNLLLIRDAYRTISHDEIVQTDFHKLLKAMLNHAPTPGGKASIARNIVTVRKVVEREYYAQVQARGIQMGSPDEKALALECYKWLMDRLSDLKEHFYAAVILPIMNCIRKDVPPNPCWPFGYAERTRVRAISRGTTDKEVIVRDNYRCCATARMDIQVALLPPQKKEQVMKKEILVAGGWDALQVAHVIPYSLNKYDAKKPAEKLRAKRIWTALRDFSGMDLSPLKGNGINDKSNLFTLSPVAHKFYDDLLLSFAPPSPVVGKHRVQIHGDRADLVNIRGDVELAVDPYWLEIHYAVFRIAHDIGMNEELRRIAAIGRERKAVEDELEEIDRMFAPEGQIEEEEED